MHHPILSRFGHLKNASVGKRSTAICCGAFRPRKFPPARSATTRRGLFSTRRGVDQSTNRRRLSSYSSALFSPVRRRRARSAQAQSPARHSAHAQPAPRRSVGATIEQTIPSHLHVPLAAAATLQRVMMIRRLFQHLPANQPRLWPALGGTGPDGRAGLVKV